MSKKYAHASLAKGNVALRGDEVVPRWWTTGGRCRRHAGPGLRGIVDRVEALAGSIAIDSPSGGGTSLRARIPHERRDSHRRCAVGTATNPRLHPTSSARDASRRASRPTPGASSSGVLSTEQRRARAAALRDRARDDAAWRPRRPPVARERRHAAGAGRRRPGGAARPGGADPRLRPDDGGRRYDSRRAAVVADANAIGTTYLRAQTLREPIRTQSLDLLERYTDTSIALSHSIPGSAAAKAEIAEGARLQRSLWRLAGEALAGSPRDSAPRLYVETLNELIDLQTVRVSALNNRVPTAVLVIEIVGAAIGSACSPLPGDPLARRGNGRAGGRVRVRAAPDHLRPRPADARPRDRARHAARRAPSVDGAAAGGAGALVTRAVRRFDRHELASNAATAARTVGKKQSAPISSVSPVSAKISRCRPFSRAKQSSTPRCARSACSCRKASIAVASRYIHASALSTTAAAPRRRRRARARACGGTRR